MPNCPSRVDVGSFHTRLVVRFMIFIASVQNILVAPLHICDVDIPSLMCIESENAFLKKPKHVAKYYLNW
jgi:hypothetical protein